MKWLSLEPDHRQGATHGRGVCTPLFVVGDRPRDHGIALGTGKLPGAHIEKSARNVHDGVRPGLKIPPPRRRPILAEVGGEDNEGVTVGHVPQRDPVVSPGLSPYRFEHEAPQARGEMFRPPVGSHEQARVPFAESSIEALATRGESHLCHATQNTMCRFRGCHISTVSVCTDEEVGHDRRGSLHSTP